MGLAPVTPAYSYLEWIRRSGLPLVEGPRCHPRSGITRMAYVCSAAAAIIVSGLPATKREALFVEVGRMLPSEREQHLAALAAELTMQEPKR